MLNPRMRIPEGTQLKKYKCIHASFMTEVYSTRRKSVLVFTWNWPKVKFIEHLGLLTRYYGWGVFDDTTLEYLHGERVYVYEMPRLLPVGYREYATNIIGKPIQKQAWGSALRWAREHGYCACIDDAEFNWLKCPITGVYIPHDAVHIERYETRYLK